MMIIILFIEIICSSFFKQKNFNENILKNNYFIIILCQINFYIFIKFIYNF